MAFNRFDLLFLSKKVALLTFKGTSSDLGGGTVLKCQRMTLVLLFSFGAQSSLGGMEETFLAWGKQAMIWGARP